MQTSELSQIDSHSWRRVLEGDPQEFERVVERHQNAVSAVAYSILGDFAACQDVTQETFWQAWRGRNSLSEPARLAAWLCGIARNLSHQQLRAQSRESTYQSFERDEHLSKELDPALQSITEEESELVWRTLESIPENYREALVLYYREDHSVSEVAAALDILPDAAKQRLARGREMLRETLAATVEGMLQKSKPGRALTMRIMTGVAALSAALKATSSASAAGLTPAMAKGAASGMTAAAAKAALTGGAMTGAAGGLVGAAGGLGGAWLGSWLPAQLAPTGTESEFLKKAGRRTFFGSVLYTIALLSVTPLLWIPQGAIFYFSSVLLLSLVYIGWISAASLRMQRQLNALRASASPESDPNRSALRMKLEASGFLEWEGRRYTSEARFLGIPLVDIQFADPMQPLKAPAALSGSKPAFGWIAIGDRATGILFAFGGVAKGLVAVGGVAIGGVAFGGVSVGGISLGGLALGGLALGGGAIGYDAVGGFALAYHSATGGGAVAYHCAMGGGAIAHDVALGGAAYAKEANTEAAKAMVAKQLTVQVMQWYLSHLILANIVVIGGSLLPMLLLPLAYRRKSK